MVCKRKLKTGAGFLSSAGGSKSLQLTVSNLNLCKVIDAAVKYCARYSNIGNL